MRFLAGLCLALLGCGPAPPVAPDATATDDRRAREETAAAGREAERRSEAWRGRHSRPETFARAKAERKYIVMDGSAEWCHWCHVMEATTYHDAAVARGPRRAASSP